MGTPFGSFGFKVSVQNTDGGEIGCFQEVSGLSAQINVTDINEGGVNDTTHKLLGHTTYSNVTLKRGLCDATMYDWIMQYMNGGRPTRLTVVITLLDDSGSPAVTYKLRDAVPVKWDGPSLSVMQDGIATESLELAHEGLTVTLAGK